jgi:hypothetical protein
MPEAGFYPSKPKLAGRAILMYFWNPNYRDSYMTTMPAMDQLQKQHSRDLVVIGVASPLKDAGGGELKLDQDADNVRKRLEDFSKHYNLGHTLLIDPTGSILNAVTNNNSSNIRFPFIAIISSDNTLRWVGYQGRPAAQGALDRVLANDPGIRTRQKAEEEYLRSKANK